MVDRNPHVRPGGRGYLHTADRGRPLFAHRTLDVFVDLLAHMIDLCSAINVETDDERWLEAANAFERARVWLKEPYDHHAREKARRDLPTSVSIGSELGPSSRRDELAGDREGLELLASFRRRRGQRQPR